MYYFHRMILCSKMLEYQCKFCQILSMSEFKCSIRDCAHVCVCVCVCVCVSQGSCGILRERLGQGPASHAELLQVHHFPGRPMAESQRQNLDLEVPRPMDTWTLGSGGGARRGLASEGSGRKGFSFWVAGLVPFPISSLG